MSRLYYESSQETRFLKNRESGQGRSRSYLEKVSSLVPAEIIAGYLAMIGFLDKHDNSVVVEKQGFLIGIFVLCLILTPLYLNFQADKDKPKIVHLVISSVAFVVWAYVTSGEKFSGLIYDSDIASVILIAFSLVSALVPLNK